MEPSMVSIHSTDFRDLMDGLKVSPFMKLQQLPILADVDIEKVCVDTAISDKRSCSFCKVTFEDQADQRQHYKLDWHRYNLKMNLKQRKPVSEEDFTLIADAGGISSISESDSGTDFDPDVSNVTEADPETTLTHLIARRMRIIFENKNGNILSFYRCWFSGKKDDIPSEPELVTAAQNLITRSQVMIILVGSGHFAASIFKGSDVILHKTFHNYAARAKQGGAQNAKDGKRSSGSKSAASGASANHKSNERSLTQDVQELLTSWGKEVASCDLIFIRAVGPINRSVIFCGKQSALDKHDARLRTIPISTRKATFHETERVFSLLSTVTVYESKTIFCDKFSCSTPRKEFESKNKESDCDKGKRKTYDRSKSRLSPQRPLPEIVSRLAIELDDNENEEVYSSHYHRTSFSESLNEFEVFVPNLKNDIRKKKKTRKMNKDCTSGSCR
ncbi:ankyrin repeat and zinc finger domain-containing protein 1 [Nilaparvata lugens]|uniref:ankyrin repeat and zinc finger domain-containing protein 1 n=1 Tax=Nilaparvata lugens TaxID=108931 RepID=UPI00193D4874|nr:ankyrin repeat and zinc finger domain-containing protein 1 [Nilaparvata lugens]